MVLSPDVRWKQRLSNFDRAFVLLREALERGPSVLSALEKEGVIQRFEYTFELAWKLLKDYLDAEGAVIAPVTPRQVIKDAFAAKLVSDGQAWIDMLDHRNLLAHTYDASVFQAAVDAVAMRYLPTLSAMHACFLQKAVA
jgi:nucleotidyltransferase substrate binding protein (TIGR01987 family)